MVDLSWCSSYPYQQIQCAEHIVNTKSNYRIILLFLEKKLKWKRIPKTVRKKRYWYTSPGYSKTKIICGKRARHKIDTSSRPRRTITWDRGRMSQAASPRFRPNREIIWHPGRYLPETRGKRNTTLIVCGHPIPQTGNKHFSSYAEWYTNFKHLLYASNRSPLSYLRVLFLYEVSVKYPY